MADTVAVMNKGAIEQMGAPEELYELPRTAFVANFLGQSNLLLATISGPAVDGLMPADVHGYEVQVEAAHVPAGIRDVWIGVRPEKLRLGEHGRNRLRGVVTDASFTGVATQYLIELPWGFEVMVIQQNDGSSRASPGGHVTVSWEAGEGVVFDQNQDEDAGAQLEDV